MNPTPTISEAARRAAEKLCPHIHTIATQVSGNAGAEAEGELNRVAAIIQSALDSAHPAPKEGETPETDEAVACNEEESVYKRYQRLHCVARSLELRLFKAKAQLESLQSVDGYHALAAEICELLHGPAEEGDKMFSHDVAEVAELIEKRLSPPTQ